VKGFCYIVLIIGFFIFYQQNPIYAIVIIALFIGVFIFFKSRKSNAGSGVFRFLSGKQSQHDTRIDDLITLMTIQQLMTPDEVREKNQVDDETRQKELYIDRIKKEILALLDDN